MSLKRLVLRFLAWWESIPREQRDAWIKEASDWIQEILDEAKEQE